MSKDIRTILEGWGFEPNEVSVRIIQGDDDRDKIQLRVDLGVLQMEVDGRQLPGVAHALSRLGGVSRVEHLPPQKVMNDVAAPYHQTGETGGNIDLRYKLHASDLVGYRQIVAVADTYDALTSDRPYRSRRSHDDSLQIIRDESGKQFDPQVVKAIDALMAERDKKVEAVLTREQLDTVEKLRAEAKAKRDRAKAARGSNE